MERPGERSFLPDDIADRAKDAAKDIFRRYFTSGESDAPGIDPSPSPAAQAGLSSPPDAVNQPAVVKPGAPSKAPAKLTWGRAAVMGAIALVVFLVAWKGLGWSGLVSGLVAGLAILLAVFLRRP